MSKHLPFSLTSIVVLGFSIGAAQAISVSENFSNPTGPYTTSQLGAAPPATILSGGPNGDFMRLANADIPDQHNFLAFDTPGAGAALSASLSFAFHMGGGTAADGLHVSLLNTALHGSSGTAVFNAAEEADVPGSLGVGFDTWDNGLPQDPNDNHLSVHWNGSLLATFNPTIDLNDDVWHTAALSVDLVSGLTELTIDGALQFSYVVAGLAPYEMRPQFGARTGGANDNHDIDEIVFTASTESVPDGGTTAALLLLGTFCLSLFCKTAEKTSPAVLVRK